MNAFNLKDHELTVEEVFRNLPPSALYEHAILYEKDAHIAENVPANRLTAGMGSKTSIDLSLEDKELVILGTEYAGEMKKGVFTVANYLAPKRGVLSMHCSATADKQTGRSSLLFGLSGRVTVVKLNGTTPPC